jgi:hypothetical protein
MSNLTKLLYSPFLQNKFVLYGGLVLLLLAIIRFLANNNFNAILLMALIGVLTTYFSKNMIIVLLTPLVSVLLIELMRGHMVMEGLENKEDNSSSEPESDADKEETAEGGSSETDKSASEGGAAKPTKEGQTGQVTAADKAVKPVKADKADKAVKAAPATKDKDKKDTVEKVSSDKTTKKQGMAKLKPASYDGKEDNDNETSGGNRIDYASTLEQAYDNIENIIGEDGVRGLTDQTKSLMNQQKQLMNNMKDIEPLLKSAQGFMAQMTGDGGLAGISNMLQGFAGKAAAK